MIEVEKLRKTFGALVAVEDVSFEVRDGEILGLLGPNGAGKSTTINMVAGVLKPDGGRVRVDEADIWVDPISVKAKFGVVPQEIAVYEDLNARDNLNFWGSLYGLRGAELSSRVNEVLSRVGLSDRAGDRVKGFSGGMKRRLNLCMGLLHRPRFLLLDEPTVGIDPQARRNILDVVRGIASEGTSVLYTTHYMEEAQEICDRIAVIDHGRILASGTLAELTRESGEGQVIRLHGSFSESDARESLARVDGVRLLSAAEGAAVLAVDEADGAPAVLPSLLSLSLDVGDVVIQKPSLESVFLALTGRELRD